MSFSSMANDKITIVKPSGEFLKNIKANVQPKTIFIFNEKIPLEEDDKIYRTLPNGLVETYIVLDRGFYPAFHGIQGHYQAKVRKEGSIKEAEYKSITNVYNVSGNNSRVNINSTDNSLNYVNDSSMLFEDLKKALLTIEDDKAKIESIELLKEMEDTKNTPSFLSKYQSFIGILADHMTLIAPFIPALTQLILSWTSNGV